MEYEKIKRLMEDMENSKLTCLDIEFSDGTKIKMKKGEDQLISSAEETNKQIKPIKNILPNNNENEKIIDGNIMTSPMVGTFYSKPSPNSEPYVKVGQKVKKGDILCIIEAMKLMNEIESEFDGEIKEILVKDGEAVEYGKPLLIIK